MPQRLPATRSNRGRLLRRLGQVRHGVDLLTRKREALIAELLAMAEPTVDKRDAVMTEAAAAYDALLEALTVHGASGLNAMGWPTRSITVDMDVTHVWGVEVPTLGERPVVTRTALARGTAPSMVGPAAAETARRFEHLVELLLGVVPEEVVMRRIGAALAGTTRQVNTLERKVSPSLQRELNRITETLRERERDEQIRHRHLLRHRRSRN